MPRSGWGSSDRSSRLPRDWRARIRPAVLRRDGHRCRWTMPDGTRCTWADPTAATLEVDHVHRGDNHQIGNLQTLCGHGSPDNHHGTKTAREANAAQPRRQRPAAPHPGLVDAPTHHPLPSGPRRHVGSPGTELEFAL